MRSPLAEFVHAGIRVQGFTLAGEETFFVLPELNIAFDIGRAPRDLINIDNIFLSHGHMDHAAGLVYYFAQRVFIDNAPGNLYVPQPLVDPVRRLIRAWADVDGHEPPSRVFPASPGLDIVLRKELLVRPFEVNHPCRRHDGSIVRSLGFAVIEVRNKLKPEFFEKTGPELVELKRKGVEITRRIETPLISYCGDTAPGDFLTLPFVRTSRILLLECTFVEPDHVDRARAGYHFHVRDLRSVVPQLDNERILITHLSRRTAAAEARAVLRTELGPACDDRVLLFMDCRHKGPRSHRVDERHGATRPEAGAEA
jgi:ribonuclease Z